MRRLLACFLLALLPSCTPAFAMDDADKLHIAEVVETGGMFCPDVASAQKGITLAIDGQNAGVPFPIVVLAIQEAGCIIIERATVRFEGVEKDVATMTTPDGTVIVLGRFGVGEIKAYRWLPAAAISDKPLKAAGYSI